MRCGSGYRRPWGGQLGADEPAGPNAGRAGVDPLLVAAGTGHDMHSLNVGVPPAAGAAVGVRHRLAEAGAFPADIAHSGHSELLAFFGNPDRPGRPRIASVTATAKTSALT